MKQKMGFNVKISVVALFISLALLLSSCSANTSSASALSGSGVSSNSQQGVETLSFAATAQEDAAYLQEYFDIALPGEFTNEDFWAAIQKIQPLEMQLPSAKGRATYLETVKLAVIGANMEELALVYSGQKASAALGDVSVPAEYAGYLACALDAGLVDKSVLAKAAANDAVDAKTANVLLMNVVELNGLGRNFLGYTNDATIYSRLHTAWNNFPLFEDEKLLEIGLQSVMDEITTGYNLRSSEYDARFMPQLTLRYGHSDIHHAQQLITLLHSEGIVGRVQLEPKTSVFEYLAEWGDPGEPTPTYKVETFENDLMLAFAVEYDLVIEFQTTEDKNAFDGIIAEYAKKNTGEDGKALLRKSWWQPLYVSSTEMGEGYHKIYDNVFTNGNYSLHPYSLESQGTEVLEKLSAIDATVQGEIVEIWCNAAFYRYLNGESE